MSGEILTLKPMASAPKPKRDEHFELLVLDEITEMGQIIRVWKLVYWVEPFDGNSGGWCHNGYLNFCNPVGWILSTNILPKS